MSWAYLYVFLQSNLLEVPFYHWLIAPKGGDRRSLASWGRSVGLVTLVNSLTHPIVFFVIMNLKLTYLQNILLAESFAILTETVIFALLLKRGWRRSFVISFVANLVSWELGPLLTYLVFG